MENKKVIYAVNSDLDDDLFYAEFDTEEKALKYARDHLDKLPFIDEVTLVVDDGGYEDAVSYKTIWDHTMEIPEGAPESEDDYWDMLTPNCEEEAANKDDLGDTTWFESVDTDQLVETLEENEDMVECKECFELFPKAACTKLDIGYICPTCCDDGKLFIVSDDDTFKVDFPEYEKFNYENDMMPAEVADMEKEPSDTPSLITKDLLDKVEIENDPISTPEEAVPFLVNDEVEAVAGYEQAAEVVADSDLENKEEILDTIDHIKEEEEEHIEELQDLVDDEIVEVENETTSEIDKEDEVENDPISDEEELVEHIQDRPATIESDQELEGTDNAVVDCKVADVITHSEDEKPVDCEGKKKPLEKPLTEATLSEMDEIFKICKEIGIETLSDLDWFAKEEAYRGGTLLDKLKAYRAELGDDFKITNEELSLTSGNNHIKDVARFVHDALIKYTKDIKVGNQSETSFYVVASKKSADPEKLKELMLKVLSDNGYEPDEVNFKDNDKNFGYVVDKIKAKAVMNAKKENLTEKFTPEEMAEYNMDEDGVSLDSYDEYVRCSWCGEIFTAFECEFEADLGWLCDRCYSAITSRGEKLTIIKNPTDEDIAKTLTEEVEMTKQELKDKFGTDDVDLINAGREPEERVALKESEEPVEMNYEDLPEETKKEIKKFTKFVNNAAANKQTVTAADIKKLKNKKN